MLGDCGFHFLNQNSCQSEIGFTIYTPYQGNGYAEEAVKAMISYLFFELAKHRVLASVDPRNIPSVRVWNEWGYEKKHIFASRFGSTTIGLMTLFMPFWRMNGYSSRNGGRVMKWRGQFCIVI